MFNKQDVIKGISWKTASVSVVYFARLVVNLVLAYYLLPTHFGLVGMAAVVVDLIATYTDMSIGISLIQRKKEDLKPEHWHSAYWIHLIVSWIAFATIVFLAAPLAARYYKNEILVPLCVCLGCRLLWSPITFIHEVRMQKRMHFKKLFVVNTVSIFLSGAFSITLAIKGFGLWSIVALSVLNSAFRIPAIHSLEKWKPKPALQKQAAIDLFNFSSFDLLTRLVAFFNQRAGVLILGGLFSPVIVGYFIIANSVTTKILSAINDVFRSIFFPFFSAIQKDTKRIKRYYLQQIKYTSLIILPFSIGLLIFAGKLINLFYADKWQGAIQPIQLLSILLMLRVISGTPIVVFRSLGAVKTMFRLALLKVSIKIPGIILGGLLYGFKGYLLGLLFSQAIFFFINLYYLNKFIQLSLKDIISALRGVLFSIVLMIVSIWFLEFFFKSLNSPKLIFSIIGASLVFVVSIILFERETVKKLVRQ